MTDVKITDVGALIRCLKFWRSDTHADRSDVEACIAAGLVHEGTADAEKAEELCAIWGTEPGDIYYDLTRKGHDVLSAIEEPTP